MTNAIENEPPATDAQAEGQEGQGSEEGKARSQEGGQARAADRTNKKAEVKSR